MTTASDEKTISEVTRRAILDMISGDWSGRLDEVDFLKRLYNVDSMRSYDGRYSTASGDITKHRIMNDDWDADWVFNDSRFNIYRAPDTEFLRFLAETVHPIVRPDVDRAAALVADFNDQLQVDGWRLATGRPLSGRPTYAPERIDDRATVFEEPTGWPLVDRQVSKARLSLREAEDEEEFQAVGLLCREALISAAQATYDRERYPPLDDVEPRKTDAGRMTEAIIAVELAGSANQEARAHAKASLNLALALQHKRAADFRTAALCSEATFSVVNILAILMGRRNH